MYFEPSTFPESWRAGGQGTTPTLPFEAFSGLRLFLRNPSLNLTRPIELAFAPCPAGADGEGRCRPPPAAGPSSPDVQVSVPRFDARLGPCGLLTTRAEAAWREAEQTRRVAFASATEAASARVAAAAADAGASAEAMREAVRAAGSAVEAEKVAEKAAEAAAEAARRAEALQEGAAGACDWEVVVDGWRRHAEIRWALERARSRVVDARDASLAGVLEEEERGESEAAEEVGGGAGKRRRLQAWAGNGAWKGDRDGDASDSDDERSVATSRSRSLAWQGISAVLPQSWTPRDSSSRSSSFSSAHRSAAYAAESLHLVHVTRPLPRHVARSSSLPALLRRVAEYDGAAGFDSLWVYARDPTAAALERLSRRARAVAAAVEGLGGAGSGASTWRGVVQAAAKVSGRGRRTGEGVVRDAAGAGVAQRAFGPASPGDVRAWGGMLVSDDAISAKAAQGLRARETLRAAAEALLATLERQGRDKEAQERGEEPMVDPVFSPTGAASGESAKGKASFSASSAVLASLASETGSGNPASFPVPTFVDPLSAELAAGGDAGSAASRSFATRRSKSLLASAVSSSASSSSSSRGGGAASVAAASPSSSPSPPRSALRLVRWSHAIPESWDAFDAALAHSHAALSLWGTHSLAFAADLDELLAPPRRGVSLRTALRASGSDAPVAVAGAQASAEHAFSSAAASCAAAVRGGCAVLRGYDAYDRSSAAARRGALPRPGVAADLPSPETRTRGVGGGVVGTGTGAMATQASGALGRQASGQGRAASGPLASSSPAAPASDAAVAAALDGSKGTGLGKGADETSEEATTAATHAETAATDTGESANEGTGGAARMSLPTAERTSAFPARASTSPTAKKAAAAALTQTAWMDDEDDEDRQEELATAAESTAVGAAAKAAGTAAKASVSSAASTVSSPDGSASGAVSMASSMGGSVASSATPSPASSTSSSASSLLSGSSSRHHAKRTTVSSSSGGLSFSSSSEDLTTGTHGGSRAHVQGSAAGGGGRRMLLGGWGDEGRSDVPSVSLLSAPSSSTTSSSALSTYELFLSSSAAFSRFDTIDPTPHWHQVLFDPDATLGHGHHSASRCARRAKAPRGAVVSADSGAFVVPRSAHHTPLVGADGGGGGFWVDRDDLAAMDAQTNTTEPLRSPCQPTNACKMLSASCLRFVRLTNLFAHRSPSQSAVADAGWQWVLD